MAKKKIEIFNSLVEKNYRLMWHISALSEHRYRIALLSDQRGVLDEVTYRGGGFYEQCLTMKQEVSPSGETLYLEIENDSDGLDVFDDDRIDSDGLGESLGLFCRSGNTQNYHEADILLWAVKEPGGARGGTGKPGGEPSVFRFPLRNLAKQSCISCFLCGRTTDKVSVKVTSEDQARTYGDFSCQCTDQVAQLAMGSALTCREGLELTITVEGGSELQVVCDCSIAQGGSLGLVHYHVKSYDAAGSLPFSLDLLGWTAI